MEVHHHSHSPHNKWTHYLWEFLMLFLAVTIGFFVENMREHYVERHRVRQFARSLSDDLATDTSMINVILFRIDRNIRMTDTLAAYLRGRNYEQIKNANLYILSSIDRYPPYTWNRATIEQIKSSGSLRYFSDEGIVKAISAYDAFTHHMDEDQKADDEMANRASALRSLVIDMDYPKELTMHLRNNIDSMMKTKELNELLAQDTHQLPAKDLVNAHVFLNEKLNLRKHLMIRAEEELPKLKADAIMLIGMLKKEFGFR
jgi:hypothetical protein